MNHEQVFCIKCSRDQTEELLDMKTYVFFPCLDLYNNFVELFLLIQQQIQIIVIN